MPELIDRQAVLAEIREFQIRFNETGDSHERVAYASAEHCMLVIKAAPTIEPEERKGRWIPTKLKGYYKCSACRYDHTSNPAQPFCSYCGAKMDGGE